MKITMGGGQIVWFTLVLILVSVIVFPLIPILGANFILDEMHQPKIPYNFWTWFGSLLFFGSLKVTAKKD